jgi:maltooligosyltrehalose synthase
MHETLRKDWSACSTRGYDFFNILNGLLVEDGNYWVFTCFYDAQTPDLHPFADVVYDEMAVRRVH